MSSQSAKNKAMRKQRTMRYFIDAAREIIAQDGVESVSVRSVAAKAGYSSGSLYEYFENIDQLIAFATIDSITAFLNETALHVTDKSDSLELYVIMWYFFAVHAFRNPMLYEKLVANYDTNIVKFLSDYYSVFPHEKKDFPPRLEKSFFAPERRDRDHTVLLLCAEDGCFRSEDVDDIAKMINATFLGFIKYCTIDANAFSPALFVKTINAIMLSFNPSLKPTLDAIVLPKPR